MHARNFKDISGQKFGRLTAVTPVGRSSDNRTIWECVCDCGNTVFITGKSLRSGNTKSCGCLNAEKSTVRIVSFNTKHGGTKTPLFRRWSNMFTRCYNPHATNFKDYGGRGISVCDEWRDFAKFAEWALNSGFDESLSIDRINPNGDYCPENCRWVDAKAQANNRRSTREISFEGETKSISEWARFFGMHPSNLHGLSDEEVLIKLQRYARRKL